MLDGVKIFCKTSCIHEKYQFKIVIIHFVLFSFGLLAASVPVAIAVQLRWLYKDDGEAWRELLQPHWVLVLMGAVGLGIKIGVFTKANRSIAADLERYSDAWKSCLESGVADQDALKDLAKLLQTLRSRMAERFPRQ